MSTISNLHDEWLNTLNAQSAKKQELEKERKPLQDELDAFDKSAPTGLWGKLKHQMVKNVGLSPLRDRIGKINTRLGNAHYAITHKAKETYDYLATYAMSMPEAEALTFERSTKEAMLGIVSPAYAATLETIKACEDAAALEWIDVRSDSVQLQGTSFTATKRAKGMLQDIRSTLDTMSERARSLEMEVPGGINQSAFSVTLEVNMAQALFPANNLPPHELSKQNAMALTSAAGALQPTANKLKGMIQQLEREIESTTGTAIGYARAADPAVDKLAGSIAPYLPGDLSTRMARRNAPGPTP